MEGIGMQVIRLDKQGKVTDLVLDKKISVGKRVLDLFIPIVFADKQVKPIEDSAAFGGVKVGS